MSDTKRKTFAFHQEDLDWINPLILEWAEENEGKEKGELIADLLQDYRQEKEQKTQHQERAQRLQEQATRIVKPIKSTLKPVRRALGNALIKFTEKTDNLQLDGKLDSAEHRIDATLTRAGMGLSKAAGGATQKLRELRKPSE
jgi:histidinol dehydrogenase